MPLQFAPLHVQFRDVLQWNLQGWTQISLCTWVSSEITWQGNLWSAWYHVLLPALMFFLQALVKPVLEKEEPK